MKVELNSSTIEDKSEGKVIMITPQIDEDYWMLRVNLFEDQYIVGFPKFGTIGIGFAKEEDWNTNLPYSCKTEEILEHIWHNRRYVAIRKKKALKAIKMIQDYIKDKVIK